MRKARLFLPLSSTVLKGFAVILALFLSVFAVSVSPAHACSCASRGPACQAFWETAAVFDATVLNIEPARRDEAISPDRTVQITEYMVKLDVRQSWKGVAAGLVEVVTSGEESSCGFDFKIGRRYLVFAHRRISNGPFNVSLCSLTREFDGTGDAADFLASLTGPEKGGRAFGSIALFQGSFTSDAASSRQTPMNLVVRLTGNGRTVRTTSIAGRYEFSGLAPGHYEVDIAVPEGYSAVRTTHAFEIPNPRACAQTDFALSPAGRIIGQLVDKTGRGVSNVPVEVTAEDAASHPLYGFAAASARSDGNGYFEVGGLPASSCITTAGASSILPASLGPGDDRRDERSRVTRLHRFQLGESLLAPWQCSCR